VIGGRATDISCPNVGPARIGARRRNNHLHIGSRSNKL
jgi:hypothetical protein